jgi:uncharacterized protein DUF6600/FecR-like protein
MRSTRPFYAAFLLLLLTLLSSSIIARAADDETDAPEEYDVKARVVRISLLTGEVNLRRDGQTEPERARLNYPLVEGDTLSTAADARVEIQIDARNFVRLGPDTILKIVTLRDDGVALSVVQGTASLRLARFDASKESFEVDAPKTTLSAEKTGLYRIDVGKEGQVRLTARDGGRARIYSPTSGFALRDGRTAELINDGPDAGEWEVLVANRQDTLDDWILEREGFLADRLRYDTQYYDNDVWGAEDLDTYGTWANTNEYGWIWRPHATLIAGYDDWAPYRYGQWTWRPPYGWTWVGYEPWGWAPYHYGRWVYYNNYWAWTPRSQYYRKRSWWRPALVAFVINISLGDQICWYPLSYHHRDPRSRNYRHGDYRDRRDHDDRRWRDRWRGVTTIDRRNFGRDNPRPRVADERWRRRIVENEPLGDVPIRPRRENRPGGDDRPGTVARADRPRNNNWPDRRTGAADRSPGVPLDRELRRSRVWNGREQRPDLPVTTGGVGPVETRPTGAVARPSRPIRSVDPTSDGGRDVDRDADRTPQNEARPRPLRTVPRDNVPQSMPAPPVEPERHRERPLKAPANEDQPTAPVVVPVEPPTRSERPVRPEPTENRERSNRPAPSENRERPERRERSEDASPRPAPSERRSEPPARPDPPQRQEQPPRSEPPPRNDPPPRSEPPPRNDPPPKAEPARNDVDRPAPSHKNRDPK